jgi:hypothetical protein
MVAVEIVESTVTFNGQVYNLKHRTQYSGGGKKSPNKKKITYNSRYSLVITDPTTNLPLLSLTRGERTGSRIF